MSNIPARYRIKTDDPEARPASNVSALTPDAEEALVERIVTKVIERLQSRGLIGYKPIAQLPSDQDTQDVADHAAKTTVRPRETSEAPTSSEAESYVQTKRNVGGRPMSEY